LFEKNATISWSKKNITTLFSHSGELTWSLTLKLGTSLNAAISVGLSRKGYWRLSRTLATQTGMTNQWLKEQGLVSIKALWVNIHYPAIAR